eukprot:gnl/Chilomastix_cuspidata/1121.p1 GENE.gnl/Chilomastix_cuspidata/1121~~gnl/Chilomastix_cuspidata/1121.p1  ORF type:complete len:1299 (+),score=336.45 gnl/Chilomastix_cuspidata/1121:2369-6265(+)
MPPLPRHRACCRRGGPRRPLAHGPRGHKDARRLLPRRLRGRHPRRPRKRRLHMPPHCAQEGCVGPRMRVNTPSASYSHVQITSTRKIGFFCSRQRFTRQAELMQFLTPLLVAYDDLSQENCLWNAFQKSLSHVFQLSGQIGPIGSDPTTLSLKDFRFRASKGDECVVPDLPFSFQSLSQFDHASSDLFAFLQQPALTVVFVPLHGSVRVSQSAKFMCLSWLRQQVGYNRRVIFVLAPVEGGHPVTAANRGHRKGFEKAALMMQSLPQPQKGRTRLVALPLVPTDAARSLFAWNELWKHIRAEMCSVVEELEAKLRGFQEDGASEGLAITPSNAVGKLSLGALLLARQDPSAPGFLLSLARRVLWHAVSERREGLGTRDDESALWSFPDDVTVYLSLNAARTLAANREAFTLTGPDPFAPELDGALQPNALQFVLDLVSLACASLVARHRFEEAVGELREFSMFAEPVLRKAEARAAIAPFGSVAWLLDFLFKGAAELSTAIDTLARAQLPTDARVCAKRAKVSLAYIFLDLRKTVQGLPLKLPETSPAPLQSLTSTRGRERKMLQLAKMALHKFSSSNKSRLGAPIFKTVCREFVALAESFTDGSDEEIATEKRIRARKLEHLIKNFSKRCADDRWSLLELSIWDERLWCLTTLQDCAKIVRLCIMSLNSAAGSLSLIDSALRTVVLSHARRALETFRLHAKECASQVSLELRGVTMKFLLENSKGERLAPQRFGNVDAYAFTLSNPPTLSLHLSWKFEFELMVGVGLILHVRSATDGANLTYFEERPFSIQRGGALVPVHCSFPLSTAFFVTRLDLLVTSTITLHVPLRPPSPSEAILVQNLKADSPVVSTDAIEMPPLPHIQRSLAMRVLPSRPSAHFSVDFMALHSRAAFLHISVFSRRDTIREGMIELDFSSELRAHDPSHVSAWRGDACDAAFVAQNPPVAGKKRLFVSLLPMSPGEETSFVVRLEAPRTVGVSVTYKIPTSETFEAEFRGSPVSTTDTSSASPLPSPPVASTPRELFVDTLDSELSELNEPIESSRGFSFFQRIEYPKLLDISSNVLDTLTGRALTVTITNACGRSVLVHRVEIGDVCLRGDAERPLLSGEAHTLHAALPPGAQLTHAGEILASFSPDGALGAFSQLEGRGLAGSPLGVFRERFRVKDRFQRWDCAAPPLRVGVLSRVVYTVELEGSPDDPMVSIHSSSAFVVCGEETFAGAALERLPDSRYQFRAALMPVLPGFHEFPPPALDGVVLAGSVSVRVIPESSANLEFAPALDFPAPPSMLPTSRLVRRTSPSP